jgi:peptide/nickel transport system permease protein
MRSLSASLPAGNGLLGLLLLTSFIVIALFAPLLAPFDPWLSSAPYLVPNPQHLLGTNDIGQDILSELIYGARISLLVSFGATSAAIVIGIAVGLVAGYFRGWVDDAMMAITDLFFALPGLPLAILMAAYLGPGIVNVVIVIAVVSWPSTARVVRAQILSLREMGFVEASRAIGAGYRWTMLRHILPNISTVVLAKFALTVGSAMLMEASLSFLGLGDPTAKSWGGMLRYSFSRGGFIRDLWWWYLPPGLCIGLCVLGFSLLSFSLTERGDPRLDRMLKR